jgi:hypothetical protein
MSTHDDVNDVEASAEAMNNFFTKIATVCAHPKKLCELINWYPSMVDALMKYINGLIPHPALTSGVVDTLRKSFVLQFAIKYGTVPGWIIPNSTEASNLIVPAEMNESAPYYYVITYLNQRYVYNDKYKMVIMPISNECTYDGIYYYTNEQALSLIVPFAPTGLLAVELLAPEFKLTETKTVLTWRISPSEFGYKKASAKLKKRKDEGEAAEVPEPKKVLDESVANNINNLLNNFNVE